jgi:predicted nucleotidyltransferase
MTKVREETVVAPIDAAARARLARALDAPGVVAASLIGSQASGSAGPLSDVDLGVWLVPEQRRGVKVVQQSAGLQPHAGVSVALQQPHPVAHRAVTHQRAGNDPPVVIREVGHVDIPRASRSAGHQLIQPHRP